MLNFKLIKNKRGDVGDLLSLASTILALLIIFGVTLSFAIAMNETKTLLSIDPVPELNMDKDSPVIAMKNILTEQIETQLKAKASTLEKNE